jgi:GT2 family glycosyltransferase
MSEQAVNITIVTYNRLACTRICIDSVRRLAGFPHKIVVVDNASGDGTREYLQGLLAEGVIHRLALLDENMGVSPAFNLGWELCPANYCMKVDNDVEFLRPGWLAELVGYAATHQEIAMLGFGCNSSGLRFAPVTDAVLHYQGHVGGCTLIRQDVLDKLGWWNEDYGLYGEEDSDFGLRARLAGYVNLTLCEHERPYISYTEHLDPNFGLYANWKEKERSENLAFRFLFNDTLFKCGLRPLYVGRKYLAQLDGDHVRFRPNLAYVSEQKELERKYLPHLDMLRNSEELRRINEELGLNFWF